MAGRRRTNMAKKPRGEAPVAPATVRVRAIIDCAWDRDGAIRQGAEEFKSGSYQSLFTTGGPATNPVTFGMHFGLGF